MSAVARYIRFDDYPVREYMRVDEYESMLFWILDQCNARRVRYILGVTPEVVSITQLDRLRPKLVSGKAVMHGFDHAFNSEWMLARELKRGDWGAMYRDAMENGGEFRGLSTQECISRRIRANEYLHGMLGDRYDEKMHIAPFNRYTEDLCQALAFGTLMHTNDECQHTFEHYGVTPVVSHFHFGYDYAGEVANKLQDVLTKGEQITLHWYYDCTKRPHWKNEYTRLLDALAKEVDYVVPA